jgi:HEAT repeat protein
LSKGGLSRLGDQAAVDADRRQLADCLRHLAGHVLQQRRRHAIPEGHVEFTGDESQYRRRQVANDRILDAIEIRPALFPIIGVARHLDVLVRLELDEFERAGADRMLAHVARRNMAGVNRRITGGQ